MIDYRKIFAETLMDVMEEEFGRYGIDTLDEETFDEIVATTTRQHFWPSVQELRRKFGLNALGDFRPRW